MSHLTQNLKDLFLAKPAVSDATQTESYTLEEAYAASSENTGKTVRVVVLLSVIIAIITAATSFFLMREEERDIKIDIVEFKDVELKNLADRSVDKKTELEQLKSERIALEREYNWSRSRLLNDTERKLAEARSLAYENKVLQQITEQGEKQVKTLEDAFSINKKALNEKIISIEKVIEQDHQSIAGLAEGGALLHSSEEQLNELRLSRLRDYYEGRIENLNSRYEQEIKALILKYNPLLESGPVGKMLTQSVKKVQPVQLPESRIEYLQNRVPEAATIINSHKRWTNQSADILAELRDIPFNNLPQYAAIHLEDRTEKLQHEFESLTLLFSESLQNREDQLKNYHSLMNAIMTTAIPFGEIDSSLKENSWTVNKTSDLDPETVAFAAVLDKADNFVAAIKLSGEAKGIVARETMLSPDRVISSGDKVVVLLLPEAR